MKLRRSHGLFVPVYKAGFSLAGVAIAAALSGCGGGGGGGAASSSLTSAAPTGTSSTSSTNNSSTGTINAPAVVAPPALSASRATITFLWAARSRAIAAPASALSAVVTIRGAGVGVSDTQFTVNRDPAALGAATDTQTVPGTFAAGGYPVTVQFYSQANGGGTLVGQASRVADISGASADLGDFAVAGTVAAVQVAPQQTVAPGTAFDLIYTPVDASGAALANISPGSAFLTVVGGQGALAVTNGRLGGLVNGLAQVTVSVDGKTSTPQTVGVGQASLLLAASGARGPITLSEKITRATNGIASTFYAQASALAPAPFSSGWFDRSDATAPAGFGDQTFDHWELNGQSVSPSPTLSFMPADNNGAFAGGTLTAVYKPRPMPASGFAPNFNLPDNLKWNAAKFPLRVYVADAGLQSRIARGFDWWVTATGGVVSYTFVNDPAKSDIKVSVGTQASKATGGEAALTSVNYDVDSGEITSAGIVFTSDAPSLLDPRGDLLVALSAHEFGHALGLISQTAQGHSSDALDTMYFKPGLLVGAVTERDVNSLENLYPSLFNGGAASGRGVSATRKSGGKTATISVF